MTVFDHPAYAGHELVTFFRDEASELFAIVAIHDSGPIGTAGGGCRMLPYVNADAALTDVLRLSRAMSYKLALADIPAGGAKSVIIGDPKRKTPELLRAFGRAIDKLGGRYAAGTDVGTTPADLAIIAETTSYVMADEGDTAWSTARGVFACIEHAAARLGSDVGDLHVAIQGVGKVGMSLAEQLHAVGARLTVADTDERATERAGAVLGAGVVSPNVIHRVEADVFAPCAMGGVLHAGTISELSCRIVAGSANNPLADEVADARRLEDHGIVYVPDIVASMGGVLAAAQGSNEDGSQHDPRAHIHSVLDRLAEVVEPSRQEAAVALAQQRIDERRELRQAFLAAS